MLTGASNLSFTFSRSANGSRAAEGSGARDASFSPSH